MHPIEVDEYYNRLWKIQYIMEELDKIWSLRYIKQLDATSMKQSIIFTDVIDWIKQLYPSYDTFIIKILKKWNTEYPTIESQSDECLDYIIDLLP